MGRENTRDSENPFQVSISKIIFSITNLTNYLTSRSTRYITLHSCDCRYPHFPWYNVIKIPDMVSHERKENLQCFPMLCTWREDIVWYFNYVLWTKATRHEVVGVALGYARHHIWTHMWLHPLYIFMKITIKSALSTSVKASKVHKDYLILWYNKSTFHERGYVTILKIWWCVQAECFERVLVSGREKMRVFCT